MRLMEGTGRSVEVADEVNSWRETRSCSMGGEVVEKKRHNDASPDGRRSQRGGELDS